MFDGIVVRPWSDEGTERVFRAGLFDSFFSGQCFQTAGNLVVFMKRFWTSSPSIQPLLPVHLSKDRTDCWSALVAALQHSDHNTSGCDGHSDALFHY